MNILILGGCGYVGSVLVESLLKDKKNKVRVFDTQWFGNYLKNNKNLKIIKGDIRNIQKLSFKNINTIVHLANIANDPMVELDPNLSWNVNVLSIKFLIEKAIKNKVKKFIFSSSGSVYGVKKEKKVTENLSLKPISIYNKTKMIAERVLISYADKIKIYCIRPATVCGLSPRMRFDVSVNMLTLQALKKGVIKVFGGNQIRPNIHIKDLIRVFEHFKYKNLKHEIYNASFKNITIKDIAQKIQKKIKSRIFYSKSNDVRSYRLDSTKLMNTGFKKKYSINIGIDEIINDFKQGKIPEEKNCYSVLWLKKILKNDKITL